MEFLTIKQLLETTVFLCFLEPIYRIPISANGSMYAALYSAPPQMTWHAMAAIFFLLLCINRERHASILQLSFGTSGQSLTDIVGHVPNATVLSHHINTMAQTQPFFTSYRLSVICRVSTPNDRRTRPLQPLLFVVGHYAAFNLIITSL